MPAAPRYINGRFLLRPVTGVERYGRELVAALDALLAEAGEAGERWMILLPPGVAGEALPPLRRIGVRTGGRGGGHLWEQASLPDLARDGLLLNLANSGPVRHRRSLTILHDALVYRRPEAVSLPYRVAHRGLGRALARHGRIGTVSRFSQGELADVLGLRAEDIFLVPNGAEHFLGVAPDGGALTRLGLERGRFFLAVGSGAAHKNLGAALAAFASLGETGQRFVLVGRAAARVFGAPGDALPPGALPAGSVSDAALAALYQNATALVFPSLYEGFGLPPLEALCCGCPVLAADIPPLRETCGAAARFFDPSSDAAIAAAMLAALVDPAARRLETAAAARDVLARFRWQNGARALREAARALD